MGCQKLELAAKMAQDASKSDFYRGLGGLLGAPWEAQEGAKLEQNRSWEGVFLKLKRQEYSKLFLNAFLIVLGAPWGSKNEHFVLEGLQKPAFHRVAF